MDGYNSLFDPARFLKAMADIETGRDEPEPHQLERDHIMDRAVLFKARVLAALWNEQAQWEKLKKQGHSRALCDLATGALGDAISRIRAMDP